MIAVTISVCPASEAEWSDVQPLFSFAFILLLHFYFFYNLLTRITFQYPLLYVKVQFGLNSPSYSFWHCSFNQLGLFYNLVDLIISVANIFSYPNYFTTQKCNCALIGFIITQKCNHTALQRSPYLEKNPLIPLLLEHTGTVSDVR